MAIPGRLDDETGTSLVDVLVASVLAMLLTSLVVTMAVGSYRANRYSNQDSDALGALRVALDRMEKEVRQSRFIYTGSSNATTLKFWVDSDLDTTQDLSERVTWQVTNPSGTTAQLARFTDAATTPHVVTDDLLWSPSFTYFAFDADNSLVTINYIADVDPQSLSPQRSVTTDVKIRNFGL